MFKNKRRRLATAREFFHGLADDQGVAMSPVEEKNYGQ
jgi:hypothetical protein